MAECPAAVLARLMREEPETLLKVLAENVEALVGHSVEIQPLDLEGDELASIFGGSQVYVFPVEDHQSGPLPSLLLLDLVGAVHTGASFSLMGAEQVKEVLETGEIPEILHDSVGEVANILCGAAVNVLREKMPKAPEYRRGADFEVITPPPWPGILARVDASHPWDVIAGRIIIADEPKGALLLASSDRTQGMISAEQIAQASKGAVSGGADDDNTADAPKDPQAGPGAADSEAPADPGGVGAATGAQAPRQPQETASGPPADARATADPSAPQQAGPAAQGDRSSGESPAPGQAAPASGGGDSDQAPGAAPGTASGAVPDAESGAGGAAREALAGRRVLLAAHPADPGAFGLRGMLEECGATVGQARPRCCAGEILFVVSRSPTDLLVRLKSLAAPPSRPALVVACSDRPTRDLVVAARNGHADSFLVLPATREKLESLLSQVPEPAVIG
ncbi:MAG: hypothetical protein Q9Q13_14345 [Acidobacteriota bacterium]|nr:hypothetical protein [Acidobacteriota bacterium]